MINWEAVETVPREYDQDFDAAYSESVAYLKSTDWQVIAMYERKREMPEDVRVGRVQSLDIVMYA